MISRSRNITVYCGANSGNNPNYKMAAQKLGEWIADNSHTLVYGGGNIGLMGVVAKTVYEKGKKVVGIIPKFMIEREKLSFYGDIQLVESMSERRNRMIELGDCFIALPGGLGTLDEISEVMTLMRLDIFKEPIILYDVDGYYSYLNQFLQVMLKEGFIDKRDIDRIHFISDVKEIDDILSAEQ